MNRRTVGATAEHAPKRAHPIAAPNPRAVSIIAQDPDSADEPDQPFQEGAHDTIDPDLRHRMISEAAYGLYARRGYVDGFDVDDWLAAEGEIDHVLLTSAGAYARYAPDGEAS